MPLDTTFFARFDSSTANNASINLTGQDAIEITFVFDETAANGGNLYLETNGGLPDDDTLVNIGGTDYEFILEFTGFLPTSGQGTSQIPPGLLGEFVVTITVIDYPTTGTDTRLTFLPEADPTEDQMNAFGTGAINVRPINNNPPPTPVCFHEGTRIMTPRGLVRVEELSAGDLVLTQDQGPQPVVWLASTQHTWPGSDTRHKPILIGKGALGAGIPHADLVVSPQHHILLRGAPCLRDFGEAEVLAPAKGLTALPGVRVMGGKRRAAYFHLMLPRHAIVLSEGAETESFYPGPQALSALDDAKVKVLQDAFPGITDDPEASYGRLCRHRVTRKEAAQLCERFARAGGAVNVQEDVKDKAIA